MPWVNRKQMTHVPYTREELYKQYLEEMDLALAEGVESFEDYLDNEDAMGRLKYDEVIGYYRISEM